MYIVGQWYKYKHYPGDFRKCSEERSDKIVYSEKITNRNHSIMDDYGNYPFYGEECIPVDISVIAKYLPENHPDLLKLNPIYELW